MNACRSLSCASLLACGALLAASDAQAADAPADAPAAAPAVTATANVNLVSQYRFRGIDQTWNRPAVQGGADLSLPSGVYAGVWASNVAGNSYPGGRSGAASKTNREGKR